MYCAVGTDSEDCAVNTTQGNCAWTNDGNCDDGSTGGNVICALGTDEPDCGRAGAPADDEQAQGVVHVRVKQEVLHRAEARLRASESRAKRAKSA